MILFIIKGGGSWWSELRQDQCTRNDSSSQNLSQVSYYLPWTTSICTL